MREAFVTAKGQQLDQWSEAALEEYTQSLTEEAQSKLYEDGCCYFIVPFATDAEAFIHHLEAQGFVDSADAEKLGATFGDETDIFRLFDRLNEGRSPELRASQVGESDYPLTLKIYRCKYL